jgi:hypothetical protein|tara:strand:- start:5113 stop:5352 length:240 start_codon:yes stop_codon:yes gene_type:complete
MEYLFTDTDQLPVCFKLTYHELTQLNKFLATTTVEKDSDYSEWLVKSLIRKFDETLTIDVTEAVARLNNSHTPQGETNA